MCQQKVGYSIDISNFSENKFSKGSCINHAFSLHNRTWHGRVAVLTLSLELKHHHILYGDMNDTLHLCAHILLGQDTSIQVSGVKISLL